MTQLLHNFHDDFRALAGTDSNRVAVIDGRNQSTVTYNDLARLTERFAAWFSKMNFDPAHPIVAMVPNSIEAFGCFLACLRFGYRIAPISPDATPREVTDWCGLVGAKFAVTAETIGDGVLDAIERANVSCAGIPIDGRFTWLPENPAAARTTGADPKIYLTSSGSTGAPRALLIDGNRLWSAGKAFVGIHRFLDRDARFFNLMPMSYLGGLFNLGLVPLACGGSTVVVEAFSGKSFLDFWQRVERFEINVLWLPPTVVKGLLMLSERIKRQQLAPAGSKVRVCFVGMAPIDLATKIRFEETFDIPTLENFALSETTFFTTETLDTRLRRVEGSVGEVVPYCEVDTVAIEDPDADGAEVQEIRAKSPFLFDGYLQDDGRVFLPIDEDGFFRTGDLGHVEKSDLLVVDGRLRDIVKKGGYFVPLRAIEVLAEKHPDVLEAAAVGVPHDFYGESHILFLRLRSDVSDGWVADTFAPWLHKQLVRHMWPERIQLVDAFPSTASGKIRKHLLVEQSRDEKDSAHQ